MRRPSPKEWRSWILDNGSYKLVALFVTLILWVTILGRRDFQLSKDMELEFLLPHSVALQDASAEHKVSVKVTGPRSALKKFSQNPGTITIDLVRSQPGPVRALITPRNVEVPFGVKVLSISPDVVKLTLVATAPDGEPTVEPSVEVSPTRGDRSQSQDENEIVAVKPERPTKQPDKRPNKQLDKQKRLNNPHQ